MLLVLKVYKYRNSGKLITGPCHGNFFFPLNSDFTFSSKGAHKVRRETGFELTPYRLEVEITSKNKMAEYRVIRKWDERHLPEKTTDTSAPLEQRIDISPANELNESEREYAGASSGHVLGYVCVFLSFISILFIAVTHWILSIFLFVLGYLIIKKTSTVGDPVKIQEIQEAKERLRLETENLIQKAIRDARVWEQLDGIGFENAVSKVFRNIGYTVQHTSRSNDKGVDLILTKKEEKIVVQCKAYSKTVGVSHVRELNGVKGEWPDATKFMLVCLYEFSTAAKQFAETHHIELFSITRDYLKTEYRSE
jgi:restriction system protein